MLGIRPDAVNGILYVDPTLPPWLPDVTLHDLKLGRESFDIRFHRENDTTAWSVLRGSEDRVIYRSLQAWSEQLTKPRTG
jgi:hypothetical protein